MATPMDDREALFATKRDEKLYSQMYGDFYDLQSMSIKPITMIETIDEFWLIKIIFLLT